eukprot:gene5496-biopygen7506
MAGWCAKLTNVAVQGADGGGCGTASVLWPEGWAEAASAASASVRDVVSAGWRKGGWGTCSGGAVCQMLGVDLLINRSGRPYVLEVGTC